ncbi:TolB domain-containing protein [Priestia megaterium]|nr:TolB domain-containing protein [Priestia megaterium]
MFVLIFPLSAEAAHTIKASFVRDGNVWSYQNGEEKQLSFSNHAKQPEWSFNGQYIAYMEKNHLMLTSLNGEKIKVEEDVHTYEWSPTSEELAYVSNNILFFYNVKTKKKAHVSVGVDQFSWFPNGEKFLLTSAATLTPRGWGAVKLYTVDKYANLDVKKVEPFATLPAMTDSFFAYTTSSFKWSANGQWISFLAIPTASMSADMNTLCVITKEGKAFQPIGKMLNVTSWFKWAPKTQELAFIDGEGRFATENKKFTLKEMPVFKEHTFTPKGFADWDFTWQNDKKVIISRVVEAEWSNEQAKRPLPSLYSINLQTNKQMKITNPGRGIGDYAPIYDHSSKQIVWIRTNRKQANVIGRKSDDNKDKTLIVDIDVPGNYYELYRWSEVFSLYEKESK